MILQVHKTKKNGLLIIIIIIEFLFFLHAEKMVFSFQKAHKTKNGLLENNNNNDNFCFHKSRKWTFFSFSRSHVFSFASSKDQKMNSLKTKAINEQKVPLFFFSESIFWSYELTRPKKGILEKQNGTFLQVQKMECFLKESCFWSCKFKLDSLKNNHKFHFLQTQKWICSFSRSQFFTFANLQDQRMNFLKEIFF